MNVAVGKAAVRSDINVTPLVDVCLVLLIIFMVITPVLRRDSPVLLPETQNPGKIKETGRQITVAMREDGSVLVAQTLVPQSELAGLLRHIQETDPDRPVVVEGDRRLHYEEVARLLATIEDAGFHHVGLITRTKS
jgi:biopolymer transport protein ExbD